MRWIRRGRGRPKHPDVLTPAEWRVLEGVREGRTNQQIADDLGVSINTVRAHVSSMLGKLYLTDRVALGRWEGAPAPASQAALDRFGLAVWWRWAAVGALTLAAGVALWFLMDASRPNESSVVATSPEAVTPSPTSTVTPTETPVPTAPPAPPYRVEFAPGEVIDVAPAALFVTPEGGTTAWVFPDHTGSDLGVSPGGSFIIWQHGDQFRLFTPQDRTDIAIDVAEVFGYADDDSGFIASDHDGFMLNAYDTSGAIAQSLWRGAEQRVVDWRGDAIGVGSKSGTTVKVAMWPSVPSAPVDLVDEDWPGRLSLRVSPDGDLLAVVSNAWVRVYDATGVQLWEQRGEFFGNPRWSPDGSHLFVNAMPPSGGDVAYVFTEDGELLWRYRSDDPRGYGYTCGGEVWLDNLTIGIGNAAVSVDGTVEAPRPGTVDLSPGDLRIEVASGFGITNVQITETDWRIQLTDGRYVFQSWPTLIGRGGCAEGITVRVTGPVGLERPPFYDAELLPTETPSGTTSP